MNPHGIGIDIIRPLLQLLRLHFEVIHILITPFIRLIDHVMKFAVAILLLEIGLVRTFIQDLRTTRSLSTTCTP